MTSWGLVLIRALLDSLAHDVDLSHEHDREEQEEECEGDHHRRSFDLRDSCMDGQEVLDSPGLTTHFGDDPACFTCYPCQRSEDDTCPEEPAREASFSLRL